MTCELAFPRGIDPARLDENLYLESLVEQGAAAGLFSPEDKEHLQNQAMGLLARQARKYTGGDTSLPRETAAELLKSALYTAGLALAQDAPETALQRLRGEGLDAVFQAGQACLRRRLTRAELMHRRLCQGLFPLKNVFYRGTLSEGIGGFFRVYRPDFFAHETHVTLDYPLYLDARRGTGILRVEGYLQAAIHENRFLGYFSPREVEALFRRMDENHMQMLMNCYEPVLTVALCRRLAGRGGRELTCDGSTTALLLGGRGRREIAELLRPHLEAMAEELACPPGLEDYLRRSLPGIAASLERAMAAGRLEEALCTGKAPAPEKKYVFSYGPAMEREAYARLLADLTRLETPRQKAEEMLNQVRGLGDLLEILRDAPLTKADFAEILPRLPAPVLTALTARYPSADFLTDAGEIRLFRALEAFRENLPPHQREALLQAASMADFQ